MRLGLRETQEAARLFERVGERCASLRSGDDVEQVAMLTRGGVGLMCS